MGALLCAECGGNDVIESVDASTDGRVDAEPDAALADRPPEASSFDTSSEDSETPDGKTGAEAASPDAEGGAPDAGDADARVEGGIVAPALGSAKTFAVLAASTITNVGVTTEITGDVGISPGTALVNLPAGQVNGTIDLGNAAAAQAEADLAVAYGNLAGRPCQHTMTGVDLGGKTLAPGVYCFFAEAAQMVGNLTLDAQGDADAVWIFQIGSTLTIATNVSTIMVNGGNACNVYWQVGSSATINTGAQLKGNVLVQASVTLLTGAEVSPGRTMAETAAITLDSNVISIGGCP